EGPHRLQLGVADVDVAPHELHAVGQLPPQHGANPLLDVFDSQRLDALGPDRDALEQRPRLVVPWLALREHGVEVDVGFHQRRGDQGAVQVDVLTRYRLELADQPVLDADVPRVRLPGKAGAPEQQIEHRPNPNRALNFRTYFWPAVAFLGR